MLEFNQNDTSIQLILTLSENVTVNDPVYDFSFVHVLTKTIISFTKLSDDDESNYTERYNAFTIQTNIFDYPGEWHYTVIEQQTNTILENGKLIIDRDFNVVMYDTRTTYKTYKG
jgi:hypothetical protein